MEVSRLLLNSRPAGLDDGDWVVQLVFAEESHELVLHHHRPIEVVVQIGALGHLDQHISKHNQANKHGNYSAS